MFYKEIICLANSRKIGGYCVAGKDALTREWIRPVSGRQDQELNVSDIALKDRKFLKVSDIVRIPCKEHKPSFYQPENILIDERSGKWEKVSEFDKRKLDEICDNPDTIWSLGDRDDRIAVRLFDKKAITSSLLLIRISSAVLHRYDESFGGAIKKRLKASFVYKGRQYNNLSVTDPIVEDQYEENPKGDYEISGGKLYLCISLGDPWYGYCYKFIATLIKIEQEPI